MMEVVAKTVVIPSRALTSDSQTFEVDSSCIFFCENEVSGVSGYDLFILGNVEVECDSELTRGMTVADWWRVTDRPANALFIGDLDAQGFFDLLTDRLGRY